MSALPPDLMLVSDHVATLRIGSDVDPYLGAPTIDTLREAVDYVTRSERVRAVVVEGGERHFSAGASRESLTASEAGRNITTYVAEIPRLLLSMPVPTVAAMAGHAIGGGFVLGLWCDAVVLGEESLYGANFMALGFTPGMGSTYVVEEALGGPLGRELLFSGRMLKGREIKDAHVPLSHAVMPRAAVRERAIAMATEFAAAPREALVLLKKRIAGKRRPYLELAVTEEHQMHAALFGQESTLRAIGERYAFVETPPRGAA